MSFTHRRPEKKPEVVVKPDTAPVSIPSPNPPPKTMRSSQEPLILKPIPNWDPNEVPIVVQAQEPIVRKPEPVVSTYKKAVVSDQGPVPGYAEGKARELVVGERGVISLDPDPLGLAISGAGGTVVVPLARIAWLRR